MQIRTRWSRLFVVMTVVTGLLLLGFASTLSVAGAQETSQAAAADTTPPVISVLADIVVPAVDAGGASVSYLLPAVTDNVDGPLTPVCAPASGALFPLGVTPVTCTALDGSGNQSSIVAFNIVVVDQQGPFIEQPGNIALVASDPTGMAVSYAIPAASDSISGPVPVACAPAPGAWFPVGSTVVSCSAADAAGNISSVAFTVTLDAPAVPTEEPTTVPTETVPPAETGEATETPTETDPTGEATETPEGEDPGESSATATTTPSATETASATATETTSETATLTPSPSPTSSPSPTPVTTPAALPLPWPPPPPANPIYGSGPIDGLSMIWGGLWFPVSQEYGHTEFSLAQETLYLYGIDLGLDGRAHPGLDIGMPAGTYLYSPVDGTVIISGGVPYYTYYGNGEPGVGELLIETDAGDHVILGHMAAIAVNAGERVTAGQFVGLSGGENGDHLHLETRANGSTAVDPRHSFLVPAIEVYNASGGESEPAAGESDPAGGTENQAAATEATPASEGVGVTSEPANQDAAVTDEPSNLLNELQYEPDSPYGHAKHELIGEFLDSRSVTADE